MRIEKFLFTRGHVRLPVIKVGNVCADLFRRFRWRRARIPADSSRLGIEFGLPQKVKLQIYNFISRKKHFYCLKKTSSWDSTRDTCTENVEPKRSEAKTEIKDDSAKRSFASKAIKIRAFVGSFSRQSEKPSRLGWNFHEARWFC